ITMNPVMNRVFSMRLRRSRVPRSCRLWSTGRRVKRRAGTHFAGYLGHGGHSVLFRSQPSGLLKLPPRLLLMPALLVEPGKFVAQSGIVRRNFHGRDILHQRFALSALVAQHLGPSAARDEIVGVELHGARKILF